ncbi:MAG: Spy/CpxP family protein refolding chaperone [Pseudomonadota bacterium]
MVLMVPAAWSQHQPYGGMQTRAIKTLSDQQIADLRAGRGMGLALAAELNGYPGPVHVLELAEHLDLTDEQRDRMRQLFDAMKGETIALGERLINAEASLDRAFATKAITDRSLSEDVDAIGTLQAALRTAHLKYHLATRALLSEQQIARYAELRGYGTDTPHRQHR